MSKIGTLIRITIALLLLALATAAYAQDARFYDAHATSPARREPTATA